MTGSEIQCKSCGATLAAERYHAGFSDVGFLYCDKDSTILTWSAYDPDFDKVVGEKKVPWGLTEEERGRPPDRMPLRGQIPVRQLFALSGVWQDV